MQSFKSAVFTAFAALFLAASLVACSDEGNETSNSRQEPSIESVPRQGTTFHLPPGTSIVYVDYSSEDVKNEVQGALIRLLEEQGVRINERTSYGAGPTSVFRLVEPLSEKTTVNINIPGVENISAARNKR